VIAQRLGRHRCTVNAEITRNGGRGAYSAVAAQSRADEQRRRPKTPILLADPTLCAHVTARLEAKDSPMTISRELASGVHGLTGSISHGSIYRRCGRSREVAIGNHGDRTCDRSHPEAYCHERSSLLANLDLMATPAGPVRP